MDTTLTRLRVHSILYPSYLVSFGVFSPSRCSTWEPVTLDRHNDSPIFVSVCPVKGPTTLGSTMDCHATSYPGGAGEALSSSGGAADTPGWGPPTSGATVPRASVWRARDPGDLLCPWLLYCQGAREGQMRFLVRPKETPEGTDKVRVSGGKVEGSGFGVIGQQS